MEEEVEQQHQLDPQDLQDFDRYEAYAFSLLDNYLKRASPPLTTSQVDQVVRNRAPALALKLIEVDQTRPRPKWPESHPLTKALVHEAEVECGTETLSISVLVYRALLDLVLPVYANQWMELVETRLTEQEVRDMWESACDRLKSGRSVLETDAHWYAVNLLEHNWQQVNTALGDPKPGISPGVEAAA